MFRNALALFGLAVLTLAVFIPSYQQMQDLRQRNLDYVREIEELKKERITLIHEKRRLEEDPLYLEKVGREELNILREDEVIYKLVPVNGVGD